MRCFRCGQDIEEGGVSHSYGGYGFYVRYHAECCPRWGEGFACDDPHPDPAEVPPRLTAKELAGEPIEVELLGRDGLNDKTAIAAATKAMEEQRTVNPSR